MKKREIQSRAIHLPLKLSFEHASAKRTCTDSIWTKILEDGYLGIGEGCPRSYVTGENSQDGIKWLEGNSTTIESLQNLDDLKGWMSENREEIDLNPAAWSSVEIALLDLFAKKESKSIEELLGIPTRKHIFEYSAVVGNDKGKSIIKLIMKYLDLGFWDFKFKLSGDLIQDREKLDLFSERSKNYSDRCMRLRVDANNLWKDYEAAIDYFRSLKQDFLGIEEPLTVKDYDGLAKFSRALNTSVILDESLTKIQDFDLLENLNANWIPNIRVSKMGGILRSLEVARKAKSLGLKCIVGAHVGESSILTRSAIVIARELETYLVAQEGGFGEFLLENELIHPVMQFGNKGMISLKKMKIGCSGLGVSLNKSNSELL